MATERVPPPLSNQTRTAMLIALMGAITWPVVVVARLATWTSPMGGFVAGSSLPWLLWLIAAGHASAATSARRGMRSTAALAVIGVVAVLLAAGAFALVADTTWLDPTGHGLLAPTDAPAWLVVVLAGIALALGWFLTPLLERLRLPRLPVQLRAPRPGVPFALLGATFGLLAFTPGCAALLARQTPERTFVEAGAIKVMGPLVPLMVWTGLLAASLGVLVVVAVAGIAALVTGRLHMDTLRAHERHLVVGLVAAGYVLRVMALLTVNDARRDAGDPFFYHVTANLLAHGRGFLEPLTWVSSGEELASALHGPAFPAALSFWSRLGGTGYFDHLMASIVLGVPQVLAVIVLARLLFGRRAAVLAGGLAVVYPNIWITDGTLFVEGLMAVFTTAATWCAYRYRAAPRWGWVAALGALVGLAALTRGEAVLLVVLLLVPIVLLAPGLVRRVRWQHLAIGVAAFAGTLMPWMIYNAGRFNVFVPLSTNSNEVLFYANCDEVYSGNAIGFWSFACQVRYREEHGDAHGDQAEQAVFWRGLAVDYVQDHLDQVPKVVVARVGRQWELFRPSQTVDFAFIEGRPRAAVLWAQRMYYVMMLLAIPATIALRRRRTPAWPLWSQAVAVTLTAAYAYGTLRFRAPFEPILCVFAGIGAVWLFDLARARLAARPATSQGESQKRDDVAIAD